MIVTISRLYRWTLPVLLLSLVSARSAHAIDDRLLVLPPAVEAYPNEGIEPWDELQFVLQQSVVNISVIPADSLLVVWYRDTLRFDTSREAEAYQQAERFGADLVLLSEWLATSDGPVLFGALLDTWEYKRTRESSGRTALDMLQHLFPRRWVFGSTSEIPADYIPPDWETDKLAVHEYIHAYDLYPDEAMIRGIGARVRVEVVVSQDGVPLDVQLVGMNPVDWGFEDVFRQALWALRYTPATLDGEHVTGLLQQQIPLYPVRNRD
ncbi:hypothetical protein GF324_12775 [bacterium]|nr:hypothetical protein [bacterium]